MKLLIKLFLRDLNWNLRGNFGCSEKVRTVGRKKEKGWIRGEKDTEEVDRKKDGKEKRERERVIKGMQYRAQSCSQSNFDGNKLNAWVWSGSRKGECC